MFGYFYRESIVPDRRPLLIVNVEVSPLHPFLKGYNGTGGKGEALASPSLVDTKEVHIIRSVRKRVRDI
jgi:hypothetical protein